MKGWIGFDLDGTLAEYSGWIAPDHIGSPVPSMVELVKKYLSEGQQVKIFTARVWPVGTVDALDSRYFEPEEYNAHRERVKTALIAVRAIEEFCKKQFGKVLPITCVKDYGMIKLYDDRAVQVEPNTGRIIG